MEKTCCNAEGKQGHKKHKKAKRGARLKQNKLGHSEVKIDPPIPSLHGSQWTNFINAKSGNENVGNAKHV